MFHKFPHTPHLAWLGKGKFRKDKLLTPSEVDEFLNGKIIVEEKMDGANIGLSIEGSHVRVQNRGSFISHGAGTQFNTLWRWLDEHRQKLVKVLDRNLVLFGEWCYAVHSVQYTDLSDWFLGFDVYNRDMGSFWTVERRNELLCELELSAVPMITTGKYTLDELTWLLAQSSGEGLYLRWEVYPWLMARAKLVKPEFVQSMPDHWSKRPLLKNQLVK